MKLIPVIDYKQGHVVLAKMGQRDEYAPAHSALCQSSDIYDVMQAILTLADFKTIYIADLDCIEKKQLDADRWNALCQQYKNLEFWIDIGSMYEQWPQLMGSLANARPVLGSESFQSNNTLTAAMQLLADYKPLLSLDIHAGKLLGPDTLLQSHYLWPCDVIVLSLSHVGSNQGPDLSTLSRIQAVADQTNLHYGGGVRHRDDIELLCKSGIDSVLIASTLHNGRLSQSEIKKLTS